MVTRSQSEHLKPKHILSLHQTLVQPSDPTCFSQATKQEQWRQVMSIEFQALQQQCALATCVTQQ